MGQISCPTSLYEAGLFRKVKHCFISQPLGDVNATIIASNVYFINHPYNMDRTDNAPSLAKGIQIFSLDIGQKPGLIEKGCLQKLPTVQGFCSIYISLNIYLDHCNDQDETWYLYHLFFR